MRIEILDKRQAVDAQIELPDVYYTPQYGRTAELIDDGEWQCAVADGGRYWYPYLRRSIPSANSEYDIVSPYGYAGVVAPNCKGRSEFRRAFLDYGRENGLVAEFVRSNPFDLQNPDVDGLEVDSYRNHKTFTVDLGSGVDAYWEAAEGRHRTAVRKAAKSGVQVVEVDNSNLIDSTSSFRDLYRETMERVGSSSRLKLPDEYYTRLVEGLGEHLTVLEARLNDVAVAAAVFVTWQDRMHYHLSGASEAGMRLGATNALIDYAARQLAPPGARLHLGGGLREGDGLGRFKRSIANSETQIFFCRTIINPVRYHELVVEFGADANSDYFPAYRA